ncbi:hypothetical protein [Spirosoma linguale]|uniref:Uncharacterized protein n=1 Tax=Spirosoma linguale (strain ATCC 33905 / DSM 74 / LMG 10896 / Claus 1) TaxID=504472 RepID=D2QCL7_SPILD|nr:hypothetical protein Slin_1977 [Spirosoma linguale DSM 74]
MKKNLYYRTVYRRRNVIKEALLSLFLGLSSYPRMLLEVFIRRNQGERYFSFSGAIIVVLVLGFFPLIFSSTYRGFLSGSSLINFWGMFLTWYAYLGGFLYMAIQRRNEIKRLPSVFDFARFSLSAGLIHPQIRTLDFNGKLMSVRTIETVVEPGLFGSVGFVLWMAGQPIGFILFISSIFYSLSYVAAYHEGDNFVMDHIDKLIANEELAKAFIEGRGSDETRGFAFIGRRPADPDARRKVAELFMEDEETVEAF